MVRAHPIEGVGVGKFPVASPDYVLQPGTLERTDLVFSSAPKVTHNTYLEVLSETGFPGFLLFMAVILSCLACALKAARSVGSAGTGRHGGTGTRSVPGTGRHVTADFFISEMYSKLLWVVLACARPCSPSRVPSATRRCRRRAALRGSSGAGP